MNPLPTILLLLISLQPVDFVIVNLGSHEWRTRERASAYLALRADDVIVQKLEKVAQETNDLEVRHRAENIIQGYQGRYLRDPMEQPFWWEIFKQAW